MKTMLSNHQNSVSNKSLFLTKIFSGMMMLLMLNTTVQIHAQHTVSGTVYKDLDGSAKGSFTNIQTGSETGTNGNGILNVYVVKASTNIVVATAAVASNGTYTSTSYDATANNPIYLVLDTVSRTVGSSIFDYYTIKMPAAWSNTSPYMTADIATGGGNLVNQNFGIQQNGFLTISDFSICTGSDSLFTWYFRGSSTTLINGTTVVENSTSSTKLPFFKITARYFTNNVSYSVNPRIYAPASYTISGQGGLQPIPSTLQYKNPVLEVGGASSANGVNSDSVGISIAFKNTNGQKLYIQKLNSAVLDLDTYESLRVTGYNNGTAIKPVIYLSSGYANNTTNDMRSFYVGNTAWIFDVSSSLQASDGCGGWCDYNYNAVAIMEFPTPVDSIFYTARITEPTGHRGYSSSNTGTNEITGFNFCPVTISGNLWLDINANGVIDGSESNFTNSGYYINLLDEYGKILTSASIAANGSYTFSYLPQLSSTTNMRLQISPTGGVVGSTPPATGVPTNYIAVSENKGGSTPELFVAANKEIALPLLLSADLLSYNFGIAPSVLPVLLTDFSASAINKIVLLRWTTASESDVNLFRIQRSSDGNSWSTIGNVTAKGVMNISTNYSFEDKNIPEVKCYYRLAIIDNDGSTKYSAIRMILPALFEELQVCPNPVEDRLYIQPVQADDILQVSITDSKGLLIYLSKKINNGLDVSNFSKGIYFIHLYRRNGARQTRKFIKK